MNSMSSYNQNDRVRRNTSPAVLERIDAQIEQNIRYFATQPESVIDERIVQLEQEWSVERWIEANASTLALTGVLLGASVSRKWLLLTGGVLGFLMWHAIEGWCPPIPVLRRMGVRTRSEIDAEKFALKFLRGDFKDVPTDPDDFRRNPAVDVYNAVRA